ncbi:MAG: hypothetical protein KatS3mg008_0279 [Acidimicrobiales bacterium]|nr:MAG: hypothetical protein KatS3mg008_0279 [Acidimicrobiales bacterium]
MPHRIEIELTSKREDGTWTWRAAGARLPKGDVPGDVLPEDARVGEVLRAEAEFLVDGIEIVSTSRLEQRRREEPTRLQIFGPTDEEESPGRRRGRPARRSTGDTRSDESERTERRRRRRRERRRASSGDTVGSGALAGAAPAAGPDTTEVSEPLVEESGAEQRLVDEAERPKRRWWRLRSSRKRVKALLDELPPEQAPIAEQLVKGGLPAVRKALEEQNAEARAKGLPEIKADGVMALAEELLPRVREAEWLDKAEAAAEHLDDIDLRDLRTVVVAADGAARSEEAKALAARLREALSERVERDHNEWLDDLRRAITEGRAVRALKLSSRPPKAGTLLPPTLSDSLAELAGRSLVAHASAERWSALLGALVHSPVRERVKPESVPREVPADVLALVDKWRDKIPHVARAVLGDEATRKVEAAPHS